MKCPRCQQRVAEQAERLAHHALRGELWEKAVAYLRQAGLRAMARAANREAMGLHGGETGERRAAAQGKATGLSSECARSTSPPPAGFTR